ncbi:GNAT family N-acetyltransferase [Anaerobacillus sp. CMMVII]|uniref:GNAT family N-acetyltransferase n=1 Tax=Anaerobacillus sp. CMMVII TaxID=2755588 RepID=UPI0021B76C3A|nr:N-acetyltransferase [Anaerobacillus sp. CMMVII]MCT8137883.1 GNAT family N-acetyltransferase [Anaerobacillus sp. CMMVII]
MGAINPYEYISRDGTRILLRSANPIDAKAVNQLSFNVISENNTLVTSVEEFAITDEQQRDFIQIYHQDPGNLMIVAEHQRTIIGILTFQRGFFLKYAHHGTVGMIVDKNWRGKGIGKALLATLIQWAEYNPILEKLCLEVLASNKNAIALYQSLGFREEGRQVNQVKTSNGTYDDIIIMGRFLSEKF